MASLNKVHLIGNLGKDPVLNYTNTGMAICNFSIATTKTYKDKKTTSWHNITLFGKTAEAASKFLKKGNPVYIEGEIDYQTWTDKDGTQQHNTVIVGNVMQFLSARQSGDIASGNAASQQEASQQEVYIPPQDDLPF
jgi:single-strand DNA-binding protein